MALSLVRTPEDYGFYMDCWLCALATILQITYYEAFVLIYGGPPPAVPSYGGTKTSDRGMTLKKFERRIRKFGLEPTSPAYRRAKKEPRFVIGCYRRRNGTFWHTLHCVVYDPETKTHLDPADYDSFTQHNAIVVRAYRKKSGVKVVTGVTIPAKTETPQIPRMFEPEQHRDMTNHHRRMAQWEDSMMALSA